MGGSELTEIDKEQRELEKAIDAYIDASNDIGAFVTGWMVVASLSSPGHDSAQSDGYVTMMSQGLPHHAQLGLLTVALDDKKNMTMMASLRSMMYDDDDEGYGEDE
jgi:hypothetical protein